MKAKKKDSLANSFAKFQNQKLDSANANAIYGGDPGCCCDYIVVTGWCKNSNGTESVDAQIIEVN